MNDRDRNMRLGLFVVIGFALLIAMLFFFGLSSVFSAKTHLVTTFAESVQGLSVGSQVKYCGVTIGSVSDVSILTDDRVVVVGMDIELKNFISRGSNDFRQQKFQKYLQKELPKGLRCRLEYAGITGMKYIDFDYFSTPEAEIPAPPEDVLRECNTHDYIYMPSVPSTFKDLFGALSVALERLSKIRFEEISDDLQRSLQGLAAILTDPAISSALNSINDTADNLAAGTAAVNRVLDEKKLAEIVANVERVLASVDRFTNEASSNVKQMDLPGSSASLRQTSDQVQSTLLQLNQTLESLKMLTDYLATDPQSLLRGKSK